ncbi:MAG TPA: HD domain-containing phosphohydrolase [Terriglobia bacterium]|nr:HD domain-containing phosphohydrolase [Terriglobia bacterium]
MGSSVLIVDDEPSVCQLLSNKLKHEGFQCRTCSSAEEAAGLVQEKAFDVVISDLRMPGMSGLDLLEIVRKKHPRTAFLMVTGVDDVRVGIDAMKRGADDYLGKPFQLEGVIAAIERALQKKRLVIEVETYRENLEQMAEQRTKQLHNAMKRIEGTYDETLEALGAALDLRDTETEGHSRRVSRCCLEMAKKMECTSEQLKQIARGSYLHDIGKIGIPDAILLKPGRLTEEETAVMQTHARVGYDLVSRIAFLAPAAEIVLTHQEQYNGTGYPQGLMGEEIPLGARIFAVADTLDAMTSDRPYRRALSLSTARAEITRESGRQFDPEVVRVFLSIPDHVWEKIRLEVAGARLYSTAIRSAFASTAVSLGLPAEASLVPPRLSEVR